MRKFVIVFILLCLGGHSVLKAQCFEQAPKIKFSGVAPSPWAINGLVNDWQTILGPGTGNNQAPFNPPTSSGFNYSKDPAFGLLDLDSPQPATDIRFMAFTHDDYNVYFYLRRLANSNSPNSFFYFCDINADGFMNTGEPVFGGRFNSNNIMELSVYSYVPDLNEDYITGKGNRMMSAGTLFVDGYSMKGTVQRIFRSQAIPSAYALGPHEVFDANVTENGFGIELAIPWKYFRNWVTPSTPLTPGLIFTYHLAMQKGATPGYNPQLVDDNAGSCCRKLSYSGKAAFNFTNTSYTSPEPGKYNIQVTLQNTTNVPEYFYLGAVSFNNIQFNPGIPFLPNSFSVTVNGANFEHNPAILQPITYLIPGLIGNPVLVNAFGSTTFIVNISLPANGSVSGLSIELNFSDAQFSTPFVYCIFNTGGGGGSHPVIINVTTENFMSPKSSDKSNNKPVNMLKVYPNPSKGSATVIIPGDGLNGELKLEDISGKLIYQKINTTGSTITMQNLRPGFYLLRYIDGNSGKQYIEKLVVQ